MGNLPPPRVTASRSSSHTGVQLRTAKGRGHQAHKAFLTIFVCFSTKTVHLEVVLDYSFLAAFRRFVSHRRLCHTIYSDRGTNFIADSQLRALFYDAVKGNTIWSTYSPMTESGGASTRRLPRTSVACGEATIKSVKHHLRRVIRDSTLTFEEMSTVLAQIEACLNSRLLQALSDDSEDINALTPGHFLIGTAINAVPEPSLIEEPSGRLSQWQLLQQMHDHFWQ